MTSTTEITRPYRQVARAAAARDLRHRIAAAFHDLLLTLWIDEITLDEVASIASTTRRTVIRLFGGKEGLVEAVVAEWFEHAQPRFEIPRDSPVREAVLALIRDYERDGDVVVRFLAQEQRYPPLRAPLEKGRRGHRTWVSETFADRGASLTEQDRQHQITQLVVATDLYTWKLLHRDLGYSREGVVEIMTSMIERITKGGSA